MRLHRTFQRAVVLLLVAAMLLAPASAATSLIPARLGSGSAAPVRLLSSDLSGVAFQVDVPWDRLLTEPAGVYVQVSLPGWSTSSQTGAPALPMLAQTIAVPFDTPLSLRVEAGPAHTVTLPGAPLPVATQVVDWGPPEAIGSLPVPRLELVEDPAFYAADAPYPGALASLASDGVLRQQRVAGISLYPVQYDPASRQLTVYEWLKVSVLFETAPGATAQGASVAMEESAAYEAQLADSLLNYASARTWRSQTLPSTTEPAAAAQEADALALLPWTPPQPGWRIRVREDGLYRVTNAELATAGLPVDTLVTSTLQLYHLGSEVPILVQSQPDGSFDLLFYGQASETKYTADNVYWLTYGQAVGLRMTTRNAAPGNAEPATSYAAQRHMEVNASYYSWIQGNDDLERWLWAYVYGPTVRPTWTHTFTLAAPLAGAGTLSVKLQGYLSVPTINPDHHARIILNGTLLGDYRWDGQDPLSLALTVPTGALLVGSNTLTVSAVGDTGYQYDIFYIDSFDLSFPSLFMPEGDILSFSYPTPGAWVFPLNGFSTDRVSVYDVTNPHAVVRLEGVSVAASGSGYSASFQDDIVTSRTYWAATDAAYRPVQAIETDSPSNLSATTNGADQIIITHHDFYSEALRLRNFRASQGLRSLVVDVQDVYDEFGYGLTGVVPIHDFLAYAYAHWQAPAPSFVVLMGDGHYDPRGYTATGRGNFVPAFLAMVDPWIGETAADNRYVTLVGNDTLPDMMIGRLAVNTPAEAAAFVDKIIAYEQNPVPGDWQTQVLAVADNEDSAGPFHLYSDALLRDLLPSPYTPDRVYLGVTHATITEARTALLGAINSGRLLVNYIGHGAWTQWADEGLFKATDVAGLTNGGRLPVILAMDCYDGYFHHPAVANQCTAETVTRAANKGAIASWSPTGLGVATGHDYLDRGFFQTVFYDPDGRVTLGQATTAGKLNLWATGLSNDLIDTFTLFGDPATRFKMLEADVALDKAVFPIGDLLPGDPITYTLTYANSGPDTAFNVRISDPLPAGLVNPLVTSSGPAVALRAGSNLLWDVADLAQGAGGVITVTATVSPSFGGALSNVATISTTASDSDETNNTSLPVNTWVQSADVFLAKSVSPAGPLQGGDPITYTLSYGNTGEIAAMSVVINDILPLALTGVQVASSGAAIVLRDGTAYVWDVEDLAVGDSGLITVTATITDGFRGYIDNVASIETATGEADRTNNVSATHTLVPYRLYLPIVLR